MNFLFLMDPLHTVIPDKDTTLALMVGAQERGYKVFYLPEGGMSRINGRTKFHAVSLIPSFDPKNTFSAQKYIELNEQDVDCIFIRNDPPFDGAYLYSTWMLDLLPKRIAVINDPNGVRSTNEKIWATSFPELNPPHCLSNNKKELQDFIHKTGDVVAKPTDGFGGQAIFYIKKNDPNTNVIMEVLSKNYTMEIILQQYIPEAKNGDKRILLLNGEPLGAILRKQTGHDHRNNLFAGGKALKTSITPREQKIIQTLKPFLRERRLYFVGIDILGDFLTEVNVTSPTCLQEMNALYSQKLHHQVIEFAEGLVKKNRG